MMRAADMRPPDHAFGIQVPLIGQRVTLWLIAWLLVLSPFVGLQASPAEWKGEGWNRTDFTRHAIEWSEITSGGPPRDGIPPIDEPHFMHVADATEIAPNEPVISLFLNGEARAYPIRILIWHEIINDIVGGIPVAVTYCPLCNAAIVFDRRLQGRLLSFGTTGKLRRSDLVMYDRQTESWWQQFGGDAIVGELAGARLTVLPSRLEAISLFRERFPDGRVLIPEDPARRAYGRNPYEGYDTSTIPFLYRGEYPQGINPLVRVVAVRRGDTAGAVTLELLRRERTVTIGPYILSWTPGQASALDNAVIARGHDVGNVVAQETREGRLEDIAYDITFAFAFHAFHPETTIVQACPSGDRRSGETAAASSGGWAVSCGSEAPR